jgi:hypothetical protein
MGILLYSLITGTYNELPDDDYELCVQGDSRKAAETYPSRFFTRGSPVTPPCRC